MGSLDNVMDEEWKPRGKTMSEDEKDLVRSLKGSNWGQHHTLLPSNTNPLKWVDVVREPVAVLNPNKDNTLTCRITFDDSGDPEFTFQGNETLLMCLRKILEMRAQEYSLEPTDDAPLKLVLK